MTDTSIPSGSEQGVQAEDAVSANPSANLLNLIVAFLTPMFLGGSGGDIHRARMAAIELVCDYRACSYMELLTVLQLIAFSLTTLDSLSLSMGEELSLSMILRLRGNANALHRSAERHRCTWDANQKELAARQHDDAPRQGSRPPPMPASVFQARETPAEAKTNPVETQPQAPCSAAPSSAVNPQGLCPSGALLCIGAAAEHQAGVPLYHPAPPRPVGIRATALSSSAAHLIPGVELSSPFVYSPAAP